MVACPFLKPRLFSSQRWSVLQFFNLLFNYLRFQTFPPRMVRTLGGQQDDHQRWTMPSVRYLSGECQWTSVFLIAKGSLFVGVGCWGPWRLGHEMMTKMMCTEEFLTRIPWKWGSELWRWQNCHGGISMSTQIIRYHDISNRLSAFFCGSKIVHLLLPGFSLLSNVSSDGNGFLLLVHRVPFQDWIWSLSVFLNPPRAGKPIGFSRLTSFFSDTALRDVKKNQSTASGWGVDCHQVFIAKSFQAMIHLLILAGWYWLMVYCFRTLLRSLFFLHSKFHQIPGINVKRPGRPQPRFLAMQVLLACELSSFEATILMMDGEGLMVNKWEGWWFIYVYLSQVHESMHAIGQQISLHSNFHHRCLQLKLLALNGFYLSLLCGVTRSRRTQARCNLRARFAQEFRRIQKISD